MKDPLGAGGLIVIVLAFLSAIFAYHLIPDGSPHANQMHLSLAGRSPGFAVPMLRQALPKVEQASHFERFLVGQKPRYSETPLGSFRRVGDSLYYRQYPSREGAELILPISSNQSLTELVHERRFPLGTDRFGRDLLSRVLLGSRVSLAVGFVAVFISLLIGIPIGALGAYYGGWVDKVLLWLINVVWSIPGLLLVIAITLALGKGFWQVFVAIGFTMWVEVARVVRGQILGVKEREYVQAARVLGYSDMRIIFRHIMPNVTAPLIVISAANFAAAILVESGLSFLGIGAQPPMPTWGGIIKDHYAYLMVGQPHLALVPGLAIMLLVLAFMLLGNALRDALDVRQT